MQNSKNAKNKTKRTASTVFILLVLLVIMTSIAIVGYKLWQKAAQDKQRLQQQVATLENRLELLQQGMVATQLNKPANTQAFMMLQIKDAYLLTKTAAISLQRDHDVEVATQLLHLSYEQLDRLPEDAKVAQAKQQIKNDIDAINAVSMPDLQMIQDKLTMLDKLVNILPVKSHIITTNANVIAQEAKSKAAENNWQQAINNFFSGTTSLIKIRKKSANDYAISDADIAVDRAQYKLLIEQLRWAAFYNQVETYNRCIKVAKELLPNVFDTQSEITQNFSNTLDDLSKVKLQPQMPNLDNSVNALQALLVG